MPAKYRVKIYGEGVFYHAYNRGYNQQEIFRDDQDYKTFLYLIRKYLEPGFKILKFTPKGEKVFVEANHVYNEVSLLSFCLIPNHFHLLLFQKMARGMPKLLTRLCSNFSTYFNQKYETTSSPFQGVYKAVAVTGENQLRHLSRYIHCNPQSLSQSINISAYPYSSYRNYLSGNYPKWLKPEPIIGLFKSVERYKEFTDDYLKMKEKQKDEDLEANNLSSLILE